MFNTLLLCLVAELHDGVSLCGPSESGGVETALHQTLTTVQVQHTHRSESGGVETAGYITPVQVNTCFKQPV